MRVRVIYQRFGEQDQPLWNNRTDEPLINGGALARVERDELGGAAWKFYPAGSIVEIPDDEAEYMLRYLPNVVEREHVHLERVARMRKAAQAALDDAAQSLQRAMLAVLADGKVQEAKAAVDRRFAERCAKDEEWNSRISAELSRARAEGMDLTKVRDHFHFAMRRIAAQNAGGAACASA